MIVCDNLVKIYKTGEIEVVALQGLDMNVESGEMMAIIGNSGSGKSTLLNMIGGLDKPSAGKLFVDGKDLLRFDDKDLISYRRDTIGFVWQNNARNLIPYLSALENVQVPMTLSSAKDQRKRAEELLDLVGLSHRHKSKTTELSGGEQQRTAIAIALSNNPKILLADEPTGNVDTAAAQTIFKAFRDINREFGVTIVVVTHDRRVANAVDRYVAIRDGRTSSEFVRTKEYVDEFEHLADFREDESHEELAVIDRVGRLQIPREYLDSVGLSGKNTVRVEIEGNRIVLTNPTTEEE